MKNYLKATHGLGDLEYIQLRIQKLAEELLNLSAYAECFGDSELNRIQEIINAIYLYRAQYKVIRDAVVENLEGDEDL